MFYLHMENGKREHLHVFKMQIYFLGAVRGDCLQILPAGPSNRSALTNFVQAEAALLKNKALSEA